MILGVSFFGVVAHSQSIVQVIPLPSSTYWNSAWGLTASSTRLYISSNTSDATNGRKIFTLSLSGTILDSISAPPGMVSSQGLARDSSGNFYFLRRYTAVGTIMKLSPTGAFIDSMRLPSNKFIGGVAWDGTHVWYSVYSPENEVGLYKVDFTTKTFVDTIPTPTFQPHGITWDGQYLYYVENGFNGDPRGIFIVDPVIRDTVGFIPEPLDATSNGTNPRDAAWDGQHLWLIAEPVGASTGRVLYKYDLGGEGTPDIDLSRSLADFQGVRIGASDTIMVTVSNVGNAGLRIDSVTVGLSARFAVPFTTPVTIAAGQSLPLPVIYSPTAFGRDSGVVRIFSNDPDEATKLLPARGNGIYGGPYVSSPASYNFSNRRVGSSNSWKVTIQNLGGEQLSISSVTVARPEFSIDSVAFPIILDSLQKVSLRVWFRPSAAISYTDTLRISSNATNGPVNVITLQGTGDATPLPLGAPIWNFTVPDHPVSNTFRLVKAVRAINDFTGDGKPEIIVSTENYWTMAVNGNASGTTDSLWAFTSYISNSSAGSIGTTGDYSHQKALAIASDLNGDGSNDVVIGTGGGNEHVYAINGRTGQMLWTFGTDHPDSFGLGDFTGVDVARDFNNDGIPDVAAVAAATQSGGLGGRRSAYLFNGATGALLWQAPLIGFTHGVISIDDINQDNVPDVIGAVGQPGYKFSAFSGQNGALIWDFTMASGTGGGKEVMMLPIPGQTPDVIAGAFWGPVHRLDAETGIQLWSHGTGNSGVLQLARLKDITDDGIDEVLVALLGGGARCLNGATGAVIWSLPTGNTMGITSIPDLNQDGVDEVVVAVQNTGILVVKGQDGLELHTRAFVQTREVAAIPDLDGNNSWEVVAGGNTGNVTLMSGGLDAGPTSVREQPVPTSVKLFQNFPNPFNPSTTITFSIIGHTDLSLTIFDILGREVYARQYERVPSGTHSFEWDGNDKLQVPVSSGVYFYQLRVGNQVLTRSMMLIK